MEKKTLKALLLAFCILLYEHPILGQNNSEPVRYDIVISEIMAKPTPETGLPAVEYIELHSRLPYPCELRNWRLTLGNTSKSLPAIVIDSGGYVVLIAQKHAEEFAPFCNPIVPLSSLAITDGGQSLTLYDEDGQVIHHVNFKQGWHSESIKQEGGWSLEMIDENWPCAGAWNWDSSTDPLGGTPGRPNSICHTLYDNSLPEITGVTMLDSTTLRVHFSKTVSPLEAGSDNLFHTQPPLSILSVSEVPPDFASWDIHFAEPSEPGTTYRLSLSGELTDCGGNTFPVQGDHLFGVARQPAANDLIINEILTNPRDGEKADYLEIYNRSQHIIDLKEVKIGYGGDTLPQKAVTAVSKGWQLQPGTYAVLCRQRETTLQQYLCKDERRLLPCDSLPDFAIGEGIVFLTDRSLRTLDRLAYNEGMHYPKLLTTKGVALERLYPDRPTQDASNWRSAAESAGYGTPGYENSQAGDAYPDDEFEILPTVFSPDNDGFDDYAEVICSFTEEENRVNIVVYNQQGHLIKHLADNVLCGKENRFRWDGDLDNGQPAPAGMYVVQIACWNLRSQRTLRKRKVVSIYR